MALIALGFLDEVGVGVPISGAGRLKEALGLGASAVTLALFTIPIGIALVVEPPLLWLASKLSRSRAIAAGLTGVALAALATACVRSFALLTAALTVWYVAIGIAAGLAQAALMEGDPNAAERNLARWSIAGALGDLAAPLLLSISLSLGHDYPLALLAVSALSSAAALRFALLRPDARPADEAPDDDSGPSDLRSCLRAKGLLPWSIAAALCDLLDETLAALAALRVEASFGDDALALSVVLGALTLGDLFGLFVLERLLARVSPRRLLALSSLGAALALTAFAFSEQLPSLTVSVFVLGTFAVVHHPLAQAQAYRAAPADATGVATLASVLNALPLALTPVIGLVADAYGLTAALMILLVQPLGLLIVLRRQRAA